jgi:hypothetical protein
MRFCARNRSSVSPDEWMGIMKSDGVRFEDGKRVEWAMVAILRGVKEHNAPSLYQVCFDYFLPSRVKNVLQTLVSSILLRPPPTKVNAPLLPATSHVHVQVEEARLELLKWIGKRWLVIRQERGFDPLEGWALTEISDRSLSEFPWLTLNSRYRSAHRRFPQSVILFIAKETSNRSPP